MNFRAEVYAKARNTRKGTKLRRRAEDWSVFSGRQVDFVQMKTIAIFCTRMPRDAVRLCGKKWKTQENLTQNKYPLQDRKWRNGLTWKTQTVWRPVLRLELKKFLVYGWQDEKDRHAIIGIIPCVVVTSLGNMCICGIRCLFSTCWMRSNLSAGSRKEGTQGTVAVVRQKTNVQGCVSQDSDPVSSILRKDEELGLNASAGHTRNSQDASGTKLKLGKEKGNLEAWSKEANLMSEILRARFWGMNTWGNLVTSRLWQQSSVEFVLKMNTAEQESFMFR